MQRAKEDVAANGKTDRDRGKKCGRRRAVLLSAFQGSMGQEIGFTGGWKRTIGPVGDQDFSGARTGMIPLEVSLSLASGRRPQATCQFSAKVSSGVMPNSTRYPGDFGRFSFTRSWAHFAGMTGVPDFILQPSREYRHTDGTRFLNVNASNPRLRPRLAPDPAPTARPMHADARSRNSHPLDFRSTSHLHVPEHEEVTRDPVQTVHMAG